MSTYTIQEDSIITRYYGTVPIHDLMEMLPNRTEHSIRNRVRRLQGRTRNFKKRPKNTERMCISNSKAFDSYTDELYESFLRYVERARILSFEKGLRPDVNNMIRVFRSVHARFTNEEEMQYEVEI